MHQETTVLVTDMKTSKRKLYVGCCLFLLLRHLWILDPNGQIGPKTGIFGQMLTFLARMKISIQEVVFMMLFVFAAAPWAFT